ncbi:MAG: GNAT family N-acetyltransferase [Candidatus Bathyarchaeia archaeon]
MDRTVLLEEKSRTEACLTKMIEEALDAFHRRLVVIFGENINEVLSFIIQKHRALKMLRSLEDDFVVFVDYYSEGSEHFSTLVNILSSSNFPVENIKHYTYEDSNKLLGTTNDILIMDMSRGARPNDIGRLIETVRGGGLAVLYNLSLDVNKPWETSIHKSLVHPPYTWENINKRFEEFFVRKIIEAPCAWILDGWKIIKGDFLNPPKFIRERPEIHEESKVPKRLYKLALTNDQVKALQLMGEVIRKKGKSALLITSNRGRGKSALLGLCAAMLLHFGFQRILITAPTSEESQIIFGMVEKGLNALDEKFTKETYEELPRIKCGRGIAEFNLPQKALKKDADVLIVDEAAGIPVPILFAFTERFRKVIFASTVHGYEGAGRGFSLRFLRTLQQNKEINLHKIELREPIRYAPNDPVEEWLYKVLLLDAEPADLETAALKEIRPEEFKYERINLDEWFRYNEKKLREFVGIYVLAHYRNRPDDLLILGNAPHHSARAIISKTGEIVTALHIAEEGQMTDDLISLVLIGNPPSGNLIPSCIIKYCPPFVEFARLKGLRVVRIAVHPDLIGRGLGSLALKSLYEEAINEGFDWIGASFGADKVLLNFWLKNEFIPIHISPMRNIVSGEYSVIVVKPLNKKTENLIKGIYAEFKIRLLNSLSDTYFNLEPETAVQLLSVDIWDHLERPSLTPSQIERLVSYVKGSLAYEGACDAIRQILIAHFLSSGKLRSPMNTRAEVALVSRCLQCRSWDKTANTVKIRSVDLKSELRLHVGKLIEYYLEGDKKVFPKQYNERKSRHNGLNLT